MSLLPKECGPQKGGGARITQAHAVLSLQPHVPSTTYLHGRLKAESFLTSRHTKFLDGAVDFSLLSPNGQRLKSSRFCPSTMNLIPEVILTLLTLGTLYM